MIRFVFACVCFAAGALVGSVVDRLSDFCDDCRNSLNTYHF